MADYKSGWTGAEIDAGIQAARNALPKSGGTMTGALTLNGTPTSDNQAATKKYVDDAAAKALPKSGGTMTGALTLSGSPASDNQAATKKYVDDAVKNVTGGGSGGTPNAVQYVPQELTPEQQAQARKNIGAAEEVKPREKAEIEYYFEPDVGVNKNNQLQFIADNYYCRYTNIIPVVEGDRFAYSGNGLGFDNYPNIIWFDENETVVKVEYWGDVRCLLVTVPPGVAFVRFCHSAGSSVNTFEELDENEKLRFEVYHVAAKDDKREVIIEARVGGYFNDNMHFIAVEGMSTKRTNPIPVFEGDIFYFTGDVNDHSKAIWYDASGKKISTTNGTGTQIELAPPDGAVMVVFIAYEYNSDPNFCLLSVSYSTNDKTLEYLQGMNYLWGKKYVACGDSFTAGDFPSKTEETWDETLQEYKTYCWHIATRNRMKLVNEAVSGSTMYNNGNQYAFSLTRYTQIPTDADYITLCFGLNDLTSGGTIGELTDTTNDTVIGAWNIVLEYLITNMPYAKIGIIIADAYMNTTMRDAIVSVAKYWGIPWLDLKGDPSVPMMIGGRFNDITVSSRAVELRTNAFRISESDNHPNAKGHAYRSTIIENFMRSL